MNNITKLKLKVGTLTAILVTALICNAMIFYVISQRIKKLEILKKEVVILRDDFMITRNVLNLETFTEIVQNNNEYLIKLIAYHIHQRHEQDNAILREKKK